MNPITILNKVPSWAYLAAAGVVALYVIKKGSLENAAAGAGEGLVKGAANLVIGAAKGAVIGAGKVEDIPETDVDLCKKSIMAADGYGASFNCSAGIFARWQYLSARQKLTGKTFTMSDIFN